MNLNIEAKLYGPQDAATACGKSAATIKRLAAELQLGQRTVGGVRLLKESDVVKIKTELERRVRESARCDGFGQFAGRAGKAVAVLLSSLLFIVTASAQVFPGPRGGGGGTGTNVYTGGNGITVAGMVISVNTNFLSTNVTQWLSSDVATNLVSSVSGLTFAKSAANTWTISGSAGSGPWTEVAGTGITASTNVFFYPATGSTGAVGNLYSYDWSDTKLGLNLVGNGATILLDGSGGNAGPRFDIIKPRHAAYYSVFSFRDRVSIALRPEAYIINHYGTNTYAGNNGRGDLYIGTKAGVGYASDPSLGYGLFFKGTNTLETTLPFLARSNLVTYGNAKFVSLGSNAPSAVVGSCFLYSKMYLGTNNLYTLDEDGNETILSAHIGGRHVAKSVNHYTGEGQVIDLLALAQAVETLTGKSNIVSAVTVPKRDWDSDRAADEAVKVEKRNKEIAEWTDRKTAHDAPIKREMLVDGLIVSYVDPINTNIVVGPEPQPYTANPKPKPQWLVDFETTESQ